MQSKDTQLLYIDYNINVGMHDPVPKPDDAFTKEDGIKYTISACNCHCVALENRWPTGSSCGAHLIRNEDQHLCGIVYNRRLGWLYPGILHMYVSETNQSKKTKLFRILTNCSK